MGTKRIGKKFEEAINPTNNNKEDVLHGNPFKRTLTSKYWSYRYYISEPSKSRKTQHCKGGFKTYEEALAAKEKTEQEIANGTFVTNNITVEQYLLKWISEKDNLTPNSYRGYMVNIKNHIIPYFKNVKIGEVTKSDILKLYDDLSKGIDENGKRTNMKLSGTTVSYVHMNLSLAFECAFCDGYITKNPYVNIKKEELPKKDKYSGNPMSIDKTTDILEASKKWKDGRLQLMTYIFLNTGIRCSECLGLKLNDFSSDGELRIQRQIIYEGGGKYIEAPLKSKSVGDYRNIQVSKKVMELLKDEKEKRKRSSNSGYKNSEYLFCDKDGKCLYRNWIYKNYKQLISDTKCVSEKTSIHDFRRTFATNLYNNGVSINDIKEAMGHSSVRTTEKYIYANKKPSEAIGKYNNILY